MIKNKYPLLKSIYQATDLLYEDIISYCFRGIHVKTHKSVLIWQYKVVHTDASFTQRLINRSELLTTISHPQLIPLKDYVFDGQHFYTIHEFVPNLVSLETYLKKHETWSLRELWRFSTQILSLLLILESKQLYCGAISLSQIHVDDHGQLKVVHSGIGIDILLTMLDDVEVIDDCLFLAPEVIHRRTANIQSDLYSFGVLLYLFFSGTWPYSMTMNINTYKQQLISGPRPFKKRISKIPDRLSHLIMKCISIDAQNRFNSIEEFIKTYKGTQPIEYVSKQTPSLVQLELEKELMQKKSQRTWQRIKQGLLTLFIAVVSGSIMYLYYAYTSSIPEQFIPNVVGMQQEAGVALLTSQKFPVVIGGERAHPEYSKGTIIGVIPPAGRLVKQNRQVRLFVSKGKAPIMIPDLVGRTKNQADTLLLEYGLSINVDYELYSVDYPKDVVISQSPSPNTLSNANEAISIVLSKGFPVEVTTTPMSASFFKKNQSKVKVQVHFSILDGWSSQQVLIKAKKGDEETVLYEKTHSAGDVTNLTYKLEKGSVVSIFFNGDMAYSKEVE